ncbi:MAG: fumarate hydratase [Sphingobacteriales bacterium]|nr:fumarate hydratase [Sphingobacteriales bacterium]
MQEQGADFMQGVWVEDSVVYQNQLLQYTKHRFKITCDSFYVMMDTYAKTNTFTDSCFNNGHFTEYAKGLYATKKDSIFFSGTFTKSNFKQKISGCYRVGEYLTSFIIKPKGKDTLLLENKMQHLPIILVRKEKIICIPKPID